MEALAITFLVLPPKPVERIMGLADSVAISGSFKQRVAASHNVKYAAP
jgi:hypothetical protein